MSFVSELGVRRGCKYSKVSLQHAQKETKNRLSRLSRLMGIPKASYLASARGGFPGSPMAAVSTRDPWRPSRPLSAGEAHARAGRAKWPKGIPATPEGVLRVVVAVFVVCPALPSATISCRLE